MPQPHPSANPAGKLHPWNRRTDTDYLLANGIPESEITLSAITTTRRLHQEIVPNPAPSSGSPPAAPIVITTDKVEMFTLTQSISISSTNMAKVPTVSRGVTSLIKEGVGDNSSCIAALGQPLPPFW